MTLPRRPSPGKRPALLHLAVLLLLLLLLASCASAAPSISSISIDRGSTAGGTQLVITGTSLGLNSSDLTSITVASVPCATTTYHTNTSVTCITDATPTAVATSGEVVVVTASGGASVAANPTFFYLCALGTRERTSDGVCVDCPLGSYSATLGAQYCTPCPLGSACNGTHVVECEAGTVAPGNSTECTPCAAGTYAPTAGLATCSLCLAEHSCTASSITICPAGTTSAPGEGTCSSCEPGTYRLEGSTSSCAPCSAGSYCNLTHITECPAGSVSTNNATECTPCEAGTYAPTAGLTACSVCLAEHSCTPSSITICPAGTTSAAGEGTCSSCEPGTYRLEGSTSSCAPCSAGSYCNLTHIIECPAGSVSTNNATECTPCEAGTYAPTAGLTACSVCLAEHSCTPSSITICPAGTTSAAGEGTCSSCEPGTYRLEGSTSSCAPCSAGSYCNLTHIIECPAGSISTNNASSCTPCVSGSYAPSTGLTSCSSCPVEHSCNTSTPTICPAGTTSTQGAGSCTACTAGKFRIANSLSSCVACPPGDYCDTTQNLGKCPAGSFSVGSASTCTECTTGTFSAHTGATTCVTCPANFACTNSSASLCPGGTTSAEGEATCNACEPGTYREAGNRVGCTTCPEGMYQPSAGESACIAGEAGSYVVNSTTSLPCPVGTFNPVPYATACEVCDSGKTTNGLSGATICTLCPRGQTCADVTATPVDCAMGYISGGGAVDNCTLCPPGTLSSTDHHACEECPAGSACPDPTAGAQACAANQWSPSGAVSCSACPAGFDCSDSASPVACNPGTYASVNTGTCTPCPAGSACPTPALPPVACASGYYSALSASSCTLCPAGHECSDPSVAPVECNDGEYSLEGSIACTTCPAGTYCWSKASRPRECPPGYTSSAGSLFCSACPAGSRCPTPGGDAVSCAGGYYSVSGSHTCAVCPVGHSCGNSSALPEPCTPGTYSIGAQASCTECPAGSRCPLTTSATVLACEPGSYSLGNASFCTQCPPSMACPSTSEAPSVTCASGTYSTGGQTACTECSPGYTCPNTDGSVVARCPAGTYSLANATTCEDCPAGFECPDSTAMPVACTTAQYSLGKQASCTPCPAGFICPDPSAVPQECALGTYSYENSTSCIDCPAGAACSNPTSPAAIVACADGTFSTGGQATCTPCTAGFYCNATTSFACPSGSYSLAGSSTCTACPAGFRCPNANEAPQRCGAGTYSNASATACTNCDAGYVCPTGSSDPRPSGAACPKGGYCVEGAVQGSITLCPTGTYGTVEGATSEGEACTPCAAGTYCPTTGMTSQTLCPRGTYCESQTTTPTPCPVGTYQPSTGATNSTWCLACPEGSYCPESSIDPILCPSGYFCEAGRQGLCFASQSLPCESIVAQPCPAGTFSGVRRGLAASSECETCPVGHYCPEASVSPTMCPPGSYNPSTGGQTSAACLDCPAGEACPTPLLRVSCAAGHYCPTGTVFPRDHPCEPGTYSDRTDLASASECEACPEGTACGYGTGGDENPPEDCAAGYYCPLGTSFSTQYPCEPGSFSNETNLRSSDDCTLAPPGHWAAGGLTNSSGLCDPGYYCPLGSVSATQVPCPAGTYSSATGLYSEEQCSPCPLGSYCPTAATLTPTPCEAGTYNNQTHSLGCFTTPAGYYTQAGATVPEACGAGYYSVAQNSSCSLCRVGHYCPQNATSFAVMLVNRCPAGLYCPAGLDVVPDATAHLCPVGQYCEEATTAPVDCDAGTFNPHVGATSQAACTQCPAGQYCVGGQSTITGNCSAGYYCPAGSSVPTQVPCPVGTYRAYDSAESLFACAPTPAGTFANSTGTSSPSPCPAGSYCLTGVSVPEPCPVGTFGNTTGLRDSDSCSPCSPGQYCETTGLVQPTGDCLPGFFCILGANVSAPASDPTRGGTCPAGGFCPAGSAQSLACLPGTYNNATGASSASDCSTCPPGAYCSGSNLAAPSGDCSPGYFCTGGADSPTQFDAAPGTFTLSGASAGTPCVPGTYQPDSGQSTCLECLAGFYCNGTGLTQQESCPDGHYCNAGSPTPTKCPLGRYSDVANLRNATECKECPEGKYCDTLGLTTFTGDCAAGFFCVGGASEPSPTDNITGNVCPAGSYCEVGTSTPTPCPVGTFSPSTQLEAENECLPCTAGQFCESLGLSAPSGECAAGFYCPAGSSSASQVACPMAHYCPAGSPQPLGCPPGTFMNITQASECFACPPGRTCAANSTTHSPCYAGSYCPQGTNVSAPLCPVGTYSPRTDLSSAGECSSCPAGQYCANPGQTTPTGDCNAGFLCTLGSTSPTGARPCIAGHYCPNGTASDVACPTGTFSADTGNGLVTDCTSCTAGSYCNGTGLTSPSGDCAAGFFCISGAAQPEPPGDDSTGRPCSRGNYCPEGTPNEVACGAGSFSNVTGLAECFTCPPSHFCLAGSTTFNNQPCPAGYFCPAGTEFAAQHPCPAGTFSNATLLSAESQCVDCPAGSYCQDPGLDAPTGLCAGGYYCLGGAFLARPANDSTGAICPTGSYCPTGSAAATVCDAGEYCAREGLSTPSGDCDAGYFCVAGSVEAAPAVGICPAGHYCPAGAANPTACDIGFFGPSTGAPGIGSCLNCTVGSFCNQTALTAPEDLCFAGMYCPEGTTVPALECPAGSYCPAGQGTPLLCPSGSYQDEVGASSCKTCPSGFFCAGPGASNFTDCPLGAYCPESTTFAIEHRCPNGTFGNITNARSLSECQTCTAGFYCLGQLITQPTGLCREGFYCPPGTASPSPEASICPTGFFCPEGSDLPTACAVGTFATGEGNTNSSSCLECPPGQFCALSGATIADVNDTLCDAGFVCVSGSTTPRPTSLPQGYICPIGSYCERGTISERACDPGTYNPDEGKGECLTCPAGFLCEGSGNTNVTDCPVASYCPAGSSVPVPCPNGTYSNATNLQSADECQDCSTGEYCEGTMLVEPTAPCAAGFFCAPGSDSPAEAPCPIGHYCPEGVLAPITCNAGTFNPSTGADSIDDCLPCTPGSYCAGTGLGAVTGPCAAGSYCPGNATSPVPFACPAGSRCPAGSSIPDPCPSGTYQPNVNRSSCETCPASFYCPGGGDQPLVCPERFFCGVGTGSPTLCLNGTYGQTTLLAEASDCSSCPAGVYCTSGNITGECHAGYWCSGGASSPQQAPCPPGRYCPRGIATPISCPEGTVREDVGGASQDDCGPCPAGRECFDGNPIPQPCRAGYYCLANLAATPCPPGTWNGEPGGANLTVCDPCPAGFLCDSEGLSAPDSKLCPVGGFCPQGTEQAEPCPAGTYRNTPGASESSDCTQCPSGQYCSLGSNVTTPCPAGFFCVAGSGSPSPCPGGFSCATLQSTPTECPESTYCPSGSSVPTPCPSGSYCPAQSDEATLCPAGYKTIESAPVRSSVANACERCPAGTYGADPDRQTCETCDAGYVCFAGSSTPTPGLLSNTSSDENGFACPAGFYCPAGAVAALPCPAGTFNSQERRFNASHCAPCSAGTFNKETGQAACKPCGSSAMSVAGATSCFCRGSFRAYQESDGSCLCEPGYEFYDELQNEFAGDSAKDCQPIVYSECSGTEGRDSRGDCVTSSTAKCAAACPVNGGSYSPDLGICECDDPELDVVCDASCRAEQPEVTLSNTGVMTIADPDTGTLSSLTLADVPGVQGDTVCATTSGQCRFTSVIADASGETAIYGLPPLLSALTGASSKRLSGFGDTDESFLARYKAGLASRKEQLGGEHALSHSLKTTIARSYFQAEMAAATVDVEAAKDKGYTNPSVCLQEGEALFFDLSTTEGASERHYPVYVKDSLLNTNLDFDYGKFRLLGQRVQANATLVSMFSFVFTEAGTYVFADNVNSEQLTIVVVIEPGQSCGTEGRIVASKSSELVKLGVARESDVTVEPNLELVAWLLASFIGLAIITAFYTRFKQSRFLHMATEGSGTDSAGSRRQFQKLSAQLQRQRREHNKLFKRQRTDFQTQFDRLAAETDQLKALLALKMASQSGNRAFVEAAERILLNEISARNSYYHRQKRRQLDIMERCERLQALVSEGEAQKPSMGPRKSVLVLPGSAESMMDAEDSPEQQFRTTRVQEVCKALNVLVQQTITASEKERERRRTLDANAGILGTDVIAELTQHHVVEDGAEDALRGELSEFHKNLSAQMEVLQHAVKRYAEKRREMEEARNSGVAELTLKYKKQLRELYYEVHALVTQVLLSLRDRHKAILGVRTECKTHQEGARRMLAQRKGEDDVYGDVVEEGLFRGLNPELAEAVRVFLIHSSQQLAASQPGLMQESAGFHLTVSDAAPAPPGSSLNIPLLHQASGESRFVTPVPGSPVHRSGSASSFMAPSVRSGSFSGGVMLQLPTGTTTGPPSVVSAAMSVGAPPPTSSAASTAHVVGAQLDLVQERIQREARAEQEAVLASLPFQAEDVERFESDMQRKDEVLRQVLQNSQAALNEKLRKEVDAGVVGDPEDETALVTAEKGLETLQARHSEEERALLLELEREKEQERRRLLLQHEKQQHELEAQINKVLENFEQAKGSVHDDSLKEQLMTEHHLQMRQLQDKRQDIDRSANDNLKQLQARMRKARARKKARLRKKQQKEVITQRTQVDRVRATVQQRAEARKEQIEGMDVLEQLAVAASSAALSSATGNPSNSMIPGLPAEESAAMRRVHQQQRRRLEEEQLRERKALEEEIRREQTAELDKFERDRARHVEAELDTIRGEQARKLAQARDHAQAEALAQGKSEEEAHTHAAEVAATLVRSHEAELEQHRKVLQAERERQRRKLTEKLQARKVQRMHAQQAEHRTQMQQEVEQQAQEQSDRITEVTRQMEEQVLRAQCTTERRGKAKGLIKRVVQPRHRRERAELLQKDWAETAQRLNEALGEAYTQVTQQRADLVAARERGDISEEEFEEQMAMLDEHEVDPQAIQAMVTEELEPVQAERRQRLRDQQQEEVRQYFGTFYPDEDFTGPQWRVESLDLDSVVKERQRKQKEEEEKIQAKIRELEEKEAAMRKKMQADLKEKMAEMDRKMERERELADQELVKRHKQRREEQRRREIESSEVEEREELLEQHRADMLAQEKAYDVELEKQRERFKRKYKKQQEAKRMKALRAAQAENARVLAEEAKKRQKELGKLEELKADYSKRQEALFNKAVTRFLQAGTRTARVRTVVRTAASKFKKGLLKRRREREKVERVEEQRVDESVVAESVQGSGGGVGLGPASAEPFFDKLKAIEGQLARLVEAEGVRRTGEPGEVAEPGEVRPYVDAREAALSERQHDVGGGELEVAAVDELEPREFVVYRFGCYVLDLVHEEQPRGRGNASGCAPFKLLLAKSLPPKGPGFPSDNAFAHSVMFNAPTRTMYVRRERAEEVGEFTLVLLHAVAHIRAEKWSDSDVTFMREFHGLVKVVLGELFFSRVGGASEGMDFAEMRKMLGVLASREAREDVVGEFVDLSVGGDVEREELSRRLERYRVFAESNELRAQLEALEDEFEQGESAERFEEVLGALEKAEMVDAGAGVTVEAQIERLERQEDELNQRLVEVVEHLRELSENVLGKVGRVHPDAPGMVAARQRLREMNRERHVLVGKVKDVARKLQVRKRELFGSEV